jgi:hypothetical protein
VFALVTGMVGGIAAMALASHDRLKQKIERNDHTIGHRNPGIPRRYGAPSRKFNDDCAALNHVHIWAFRRIRGNGLPIRPITHIDRRMDLRP